MSQNELTIVYLYFNYKQIDNSGLRKIEGLASSGPPGTFPIIKTFEARLLNFVLNPISGPCPTRPFETPRF